MKIIEIKNQQDFDKLPNNVVGNIVITGGIKIPCTKGSMMSVHGGTVRLSGAAKIYAFRSIVIAEGVSTVIAENSDVTASENTSVFSHDNSQVVAWGHAIIMASGRSAVHVMGKAEVTAAVGCHLWGDGKKCWDIPDIPDRKKVCELAEALGRDWDRADRRPIEGLNALINFKSDPSELNRRIALKAISGLKSAYKVREAEWHPTSVFTTGTDNQNAVNALSALENIEVYGLDVLG